jgi:methyl-accepting chemotaxis protein
MLRWINDLQITKKLWLNAGVGLTSICLIWLFILYITRTTDQSFDDVEWMLQISDAAGDTAGAVRLLGEPAREALGDWNVLEAQKHLEGNLSRYREHLDRLKKLLVNEKSPKVTEGLSQVEAGASKIIDLSKKIFQLADEKVMEESKGKLIGAQAAIEKAIETSAEMSRVGRRVGEAMDATVMVLREESTQLFKENVAANQRLSLFSFFLFLASATLTLLVSYLIARSVSHPVDQLQSAVKAIGGGDLNRTIEVEGRDEISSFARSFADMVGDLRGLVSGIQSGSRQIASTSEELSASSQQMSANSEETERLASTVSSASEQTNRNVQAVATAAEEMTATLKEISKNVMKATQVTSEAVKVAEGTHRTIGKLGESSVEIGKVVKVITAIAQQTNLLALNAAIEAARAGEAGKGFAVVANEVKDLAKKTAKATEEIGQKISVIQTDTKEAVTAIGEISGIIAQINEISTAISGAVEEQTATTNEISRSVTEAARGTGEVTESIGGVATAAKSTAEGAAGILAASQKLAKMSNDLMAMVGKFRVDQTR